MPIIASLFIICYQPLFRRTKCNKKRNLGSLLKKLQNTWELEKRLFTIWFKKREIPANKIGKKWIFNKENLDVWVLSQHPIESFFTNIDFNIENNDHLREPQKESYSKVYDFFIKDNKNKAIIQIPVGCGKTGLASLLPLGIAKGRVLIISPNLKNKRRTVRNDEHCKSPKMFLEEV